ncbi:MAG: histidinol dehydrogenase, partial [Alphaproteobacteria bacterium]
MRYLKKAPPAEERAEADHRARVAELIDRVRREGDAGVLALAAEFDGWQGPVVLDEEKKSALIAQLPQRQKDDLKFAHDQVRRFAEAQAASIREFEIEPHPGVRLGQRIVPVDCAGCYVPGGRYAHAASAIMSITTARVAGVPYVIAATPPRGDAIDPAVAYAMDLAGADMILELGGVQA